MKYDIKPGMHSGNYKPGDILNFTPGIYDYFTSDGMSGTQDDPILLNFNSGVIFEKGFDFNNVGWLILDGGINKNLVINGASGVPLSFKGKCNNIEIKGVSINGAYSWIWFKTEVNENAFANWNYWKKNPNGTISANYVMSGLKLSNFDFKNANFDGGYICSTGQRADRPVTIDGKTYYPFPPKVENIQISNGVMDGCSRTGLQISGLTENGISFLKNVTIKNSGKSLEQNQGASFRIGGNSSNFEIDNCVFDGSHIYAVHSQGGGLIKFTNNKVLNSCVVNGNTNPDKMASVEFDTFEDNPATIIISGNDIGASNNGVSVVVYGSPKTLTEDGNILSNNDLKGSFQNFSGVTFNDDSVIPPVSRVSYFTLDENSSTAVIYYEDGTFVNISNVDRVVGSVKNGKKKWWYIDKNSVKHSL